MPLGQYGSLFVVAGVLTSLTRTTLVLGLYQRHALKAFRASVRYVEGHETDGILAQEGVQPDKSLHNQFLPHPVSVDAS